MAFFVDDDDDDDEYANENNDNHVNLKICKETFPSLSSSIFFIVISIRSWVQGLTIGVGVIIIKYVIKLSPSPPHLHRPQGPDKTFVSSFKVNFTIK